MLLTAHRDGKTEVTSWFSFFSVLPFHPVSLLCLLIFTHSLISCRDFNMLDAEKIPVIWEYAIKYMRDCLCDLWYFYEYIIGSWEQVFFTNSPNMCVAKLKREWFDSTYIAFISVTVHPLQSDPSVVWVFTCQSAEFILHQKSLQMYNPIYWRCFSDKLRQNFFPFSTALKVYPLAKDEEWDPSSTLSSSKSAGVLLSDSIKLPYYQVTILFTWLIAQQSYSPNVLCILH